MKALVGSNANIYDAEDGEQALDYLREKVIHLAFIDFNMPKANGVEVIERYLADDPPHTPYFFMVTTETGSDVVMAALKAGAHNFITKSALEASFDRKVAPLLLNQA